MTSPKPAVTTYANRDALALGVAERLVERLVAAQTARGEATVVVTGGGVGTAVLAALADPDRTGRLDWSRVNVWWGDERFLPDGDSERNVTQAEEVLLSKVPLDPERVHAFPASGPLRPQRGEVAAEADRYAAILATAAAEEAGEVGGAELPHFDVLLLGVGDEGHIASIFPDSEALTDARTVAPVFDSLKPPPTRLTLTLRAINTADEVWLIVGGADKAEAVGKALAGSSPAEIPAAGASGRLATHWLIDTAAATKIPASVEVVSAS